MDKNAYEFSMDFEFNGVQAYLNLAKESKNMLSKNLFYSLAIQEAEHAKRIDEFFFDPQNKAEIVFESAIPGIESEMKQLFAQMEEKTKKASPDNPSIYKSAIEMERKGYETYRKFYQQTKDAGEKRFFKFLMEEEQKHIDSLANVIFYLTDTGDWLEEDESRTWNWMNL